MKKNENITPFVTVIIPTYYDWGRLQLCLNYLSEQTYDNNSFEIIVVNNSPKDLVPEEFILPCNAYIIDESKPGSYSARNKAVNLAKGDIIAFTDSDCKPERNWLEVAVKAFTLQPDLERIGGNIKLFSNNLKPNWYEIYEMYFAFPQKDFVKNGGMAATGNMLTRKQVFDKVGLFNDGLLSGGDGEWGKRAHKLGSTIIYLEDCIVYHPTRSEVTQINIKNKRLAGGHFLIAKNDGIISLFVLLAKSLFPPFKAAKRLVKNKDGTIKRKCIALLVCYHLKLKAALEIFKLMVGASSLERN